MSDQPRAGPVRSNVQVLLGFLFGILASLAWLLFTIVFAASLGMRHRATYVSFEAIGLIVLGIVAFRNVRQSSYAKGLLIAVSLSLLLDAIAAAYLAIR